MTTAKSMSDVTASENKLQDEVAQALAEAKKQGASSAEVSASESLGLEVVVRKQDIETLEFNQHHRISIAVYLGQKKGTASTADGSAEGLANAVRAALNIAQHTEEDVYSGLEDPALMAGQRVDLNLFHPWDLSVEQAEELARTCEAEALDVAGVFDTDGGAVGTDRIASVYGNSHGFMGVHSGSRHSMSCVALARDDHGKQRDYAVCMVRDPSLLEEAAVLGREAGNKAVSHLNAQPLESGVMPVLFSPRMARGLVSHLLDAISGGSIYRKASFLMDKLDEVVTASHLTIREAPLLEGGLGSRYHDGDGVGTRDNVFIDKGRLNQYLLGSYSARRLGMQTTGNAGGAHNVLLDGHTLGFADLLKEMDNGVLITSLMGQGVNIVNGDFSRGAQGFKVENGTITEPVEEFTIASNLADMFQQIVALGDDVDRQGNIQVPSILVERMTIAGNHR